MIDPDYETEYPDIFEGITTLAAPPPSTVDIERAMTEGRRTRLKRTIGVTGGMAAGLAAICAAALVIPESHPAPIEAANSVLPVTGTNPFVVGARFGWLPSGVQLVSSTLSRGALWLIAQDSVPEHEFWLSTFPSGSSEQSALAAITADNYHPVTTRAISPIDGRPAYSVSSPDEVTLLWQLTNGRWAEVVETGSATLTAQARHVAETVTPDETATPLPMSVTGLPSGGQITYYSLTRATTSPTSWGLEFDINVAGVTLVYDEGLVGQVMPMALGPSKCVTHGALEGCVTLTSGHLTGSLQALADDINLRTPDQSSWTTEVFPG